MAVSNATFVPARYHNNGDIDQTGARYANIDVTYDLFYVVTTYDK